MDLKRPEVMFCAWVFWLKAHPPKDKPSKSFLLAAEKEPITAPPRTC